MRKSDGKWVMVYCDHCGNLAERQAMDKHKSEISISGLALEWCSDCIAKDNEERAKRAAEERAIRDAKDKAFRAFLKKHKISESKLRDILPDDFFGDDDY